MNYHELHHFYIQNLIFPENEITLLNQTKVITQSNAYNKISKHKHPSIIILLSQTRDACVIRIYTISRVLTKKNDGLVVTYECRLHGKGFDSHCKQSLKRKKITGAKQAFQKYDRASLPAEIFLPFIIIPPAKAMPVLLEAFATCFFNGDSAFGMGYTT